MINQKGQTLLEIVFVLAIVIIALLGILGLIMSNIAGTKVSKTRIIASNLAREGVEVIRQIRDTNWLALERWDEHLTNQLDDQTAIVVFSPENNTWQLDFAPNDLPDAGTIIYLDMLTGIYQQATELILTGQPTAYRRLITLNEICSNGDFKPTGETCDEVVNGKVGLKVTSEVQWQEKGQVLSAVVEDWLYNWR